MMDSIAVSRSDFVGLDDVPPTVLESLVEVGLPSRFDRFEIDFSPKRFSIAMLGDDRFLAIGGSESGSVAIDLQDGSVWWILRAIDHPLELRTPGYRQFFNGNIGAFVRCAKASEALLDDAGTDAVRLREIIREIDSNALAPDREGVWLDVVGDWEAGL